MAEPVEVRHAVAADGVTAAEAGRRTAYVVEDSAAQVLVRTTFTSPTRVVATASAPLTEAGRSALCDEIAWWAPQVGEVVIGGGAYALDAAPLQWLPLADLRVGQLSVSRDKIDAHRWVARAEDVVVCCCELDGETVVVDGHSRLVAAWRAGIGTVDVVVEEAGELQRVARGWCRDAGLDTVADLAEHGVVPADEHARRWVDRCQAWLAAHGDA